MSSLIENPLNFEADDLLAMIESDPESFTMGRRNNDMVNWFIAKRLSEISDSRETAPALVRYYEAAFNSVPLNGTQRDDLRIWECSVHEKIWHLHTAYAYIEQPAVLARLWIPQEYDLPGANNLSLF